MSPIVSITATNEYHWPNGFDPIVSKIWPGTFTGWYWDNNVEEKRIRNTLVKGEWDKLQKNSGCKEIKEQNPIILKKFYNSSLIWVQRMGLPIIDVERPFTHGGHCPPDLKLCGPSVPKISLPLPSIWGLFRKKIK